jgi:hypothetical protein
MTWPDRMRERLIVSFVGISSTSPAHSPNRHSNIIQGFQKLQIASAACRIAETFSAAGTPEFASPEQFAGVGVDIRSDLYLVGEQPLRPMSQVSGLHPITNGLRSPSFRGSAKLAAAKRLRISNRVMRMSNHVAKTGRGGSYGADCFSFDLRTVQKAQNFRHGAPFHALRKQ